MSSYIMLIGFTQQGVADIKKLPLKIRSSASILKKAGVKPQIFYTVMGMDRYDGFFIIQAADEAKAAAAALALESKGDVHTNTLRAFTEKEFQDVIALLS